MQNLPIASTQPAASAPQGPVSVPDNGGAAPATEPFNAVLERQIADAATATGQSTQPAATLPGQDGALLVATGSDKLAKSQDAATVAASTLPADMLAALQPAAGAIEATGDKKIVPLTPDAAASGTLPDSVLAILLPAAGATDITTGKKTAPLAPDPAAATSAAGMLAALLPVPQAAVVQVASPVPQQQPALAVGTTDKVPQPAVFQANSPAAQMQDNVMSALAANANALQADAFSAKLVDAMGGNTSPPPQTPAPVAQPDTTALSSVVPANAPVPAAIVPNGPVQLAVNTPVAHDGWGDELSQKVTWMSTQHEQTAELHLNPPQLGPLDVVLHVSGDQATAMFTSPHAAVRDAVELALPKLREMLAGNGIMLGNATVSDQAPRDQQPSGNRQASSGIWTGRNAEIAPASSIQAGATAWPIRRQQGMVDTFA
jgi:flagellar hook-length control protein FliK